MIKRVVGVEGDEVAVRDGVLYINGAAQVWNTTALVCFSLV